MMSGTASPFFRLGICVSMAVLAGTAPRARADVTIEEKTSINAIFTLNGTTTDQYTVDKERSSTEFHCNALMSWICSKGNSGAIVRIDKGMTYDLQPEKKSYTEQPFPTEADRLAMQQRMSAAIEKMKQCAAEQPATKPAVDTSDCDMSPPVLEVKNLGDAGQIIGHGVQRAAITMTQSCTNKKTGDVCDMQFGFDLFLTGDTIPGMEERTAFQKAFLAKMGFNSRSAIEMQKQVQQVLAPYAAQMKQLSAKFADVKGHPLRTSFHFAYGGPRCAASQKSVSSDSSGGSGGGIGSPSAMLTQAGGKLLSGLFSKKKDAAADAAPEEPAAPGMVTAVKFTTETTAIRTDPIPADQFEVPAGWTLIVPKTGKPEEFKCDKPGK